MYTPFSMDGKSPVMKKLIGGQKNLARNGAPELQAAISASPARKNKTKNTEIRNLANANEFAKNTSAKNREAYKIAVEKRLGKETNL